MRKNIAGQQIPILAWDMSNNEEKTGDAANITAQISLDGAASIALDDNGANPTELDATDAPGVYIFDLTQEETNGDMIIISAVSSTSGVRMNPIVIRTRAYKDRLLPRHHGI